MLSQRGVTRQYQQIRVQPRCWEECIQGSPQCWITETALCFLPYSQCLCHCWCHAFSDPPQKGAIRTQQHFYPSSMQTSVPLILIRITLKRRPRNDSFCPSIVSRLESEGVSWTFLFYKWENWVSSQGWERTRKILTLSDHLGSSEVWWLP